MAPAESASISAGPALKTCVLSLVVPSASCKNPFCSPAIAGAWVTLAKYPRRSCEAGALEEEAAVGELHPVRTVTRAAVIIVVSPMERIRRVMMRAPLGVGMGLGGGCELVFRADGGGGGLCGFRGSGGPDRRRATRAISDREGRCGVRFAFQVTGLCDNAGCEGRPRLRINDQKRTSPAISRVFFDR